MSAEGGFWRARHPTIYGAARAIKPTEIGDAAKQANRDKTLMKQGRRDATGCPRRGDRCGDRVNGGKNEVIVLENQVQVLPEARYGLSLK